MRPLKRRFNRFIKKKTEVFLVIVFAVVLALFLGIKIAQHRVPEDVKNASLVLQAMEKASCVGEAWGLDIYLGKKNERLLAQPLSKEKCLIASLFAEKILRVAPWERSLDDLKYTFYVLREERVRRLSEATVFLIRAKEWRRDLLFKDEPLAPQDALILKGLREEEKELPAEEMIKRYQAMSWKTKREPLKVRFLAREAYLDQGRPAGLERKLQQLKRYERDGQVPFSIILATNEMSRGMLSPKEPLVFSDKSPAPRKPEGVLPEYQKALERLSSGDAAGFVDEAEALAARYGKKDFAPLLLYQAWSVSKYDLEDSARAETILVGLKKKYPISDWAYPERAPEFLKKKAGFKSKKPRGLGTLLLPFNVLRGPSQNIAEEFLDRIQEISDELAPGTTREIVLEEIKAQERFGDLLPLTQKRLKGYQINLCDQGARIFWGEKAGFLDVVFLVRGALDPEGDSGFGGMALKLQEIRVQGVAVPRAFLRQIEGDFKALVEKANIPLDLVEAKYWKGGAKFVFKKREVVETSVLNESFPPESSSEGDVSHA